MFNFFNKTKQNIQSDVTTTVTQSSVASITYYVNENNELILDIQLEDYSDKSLLGLCHILDAMSTQKCLLETLEIIKSFFTKDGKEEELIKILTHVANNKEIFKKQYSTNAISSKPCIKPSDMI